MLSIFRLRDRLRLRLPPAIIPRLVADRITLQTTPAGQRSVAGIITLQAATLQRSVAGIITLRAPTMQRSLAGRLTVRSPTLQRSLAERITLQTTPIQRSLADSLTLQAAYIHRSLAALMLLLLCLGKMLRHPAISQTMAT